MKRELYWLGGVGLGAGLMYWLDPARGRHRRMRTRTQLLSARHRVGDLIAEATPDLHDLHLPRRYLPQLRYRPQLLASFKRQRRHANFDTIWLVLAGLGLSAALAWTARSSDNALQLRERASHITLQPLRDWTYGAWDGVRTWFQSEVRSTNAPNRPHEREHEVTMMGVEAESTKDVEGQ